MTYEDLDTWHGDDSGLDTLLRELLDGLDTKRDLGTGRDDGDVGILGVLEDVTTPGGLLDGRVGELGKLDRQLSVQNEQRNVTLTFCREKAMTEGVC